MIEIFKRLKEADIKATTKHECTCGNEKCNSKTGSCNCHSHDTPKHEPLKTNHQPDPNNLIGEVFGDYKVVDGSDRDGSGHKLWRCECMTCGDTFKTTSYELLKGRKKTVCKKCAHDDTPTPIKVTVTKVTNTNPIEEKADKSVDKSVDKSKPTNTTSPYFIDFNIHLLINEEQTDLLTMPVFYTIAHCLPADITAYGETARRIDYVYNLIENIKADYELWGEKPEVGDISYIRNVFTLFATPRKHVRANMADLRKCVKNMAQFCVDSDIKYLAMPRIGCGHNGLIWEEVREMICEEFEAAYADAPETSIITITFCYQ